MHKAGNPVSQKGENLGKKLSWTSFQSRPRLMQQTAKMVTGGGSPRKERGLAIMKLWQTNLAVQAEEAANLCIFCEQYGHYPVDCPQVRHRQAAPPKDGSLVVYVAFVVFVVGLILGMFIMKAAMS